MSLGFGFEYRGSPPMPVVTVLEPDGPAIAAGVQVGDTIWQVDGVDIPGLQVDARELLINNNPEVKLTLQAPDSFLSNGAWGFPGMGSLRMAPQRRSVTVKRRFAAGSAGKQEPLLSPGAMAARDRGRRLFKEGKFEEAAAAFTEAISGSPNAYTLLTNRALCNQKLGRWTQVEEDAREALRQATSSVKAHYLLGRALLELGRAEEAKTALLNSMSHSSSPEFKSYRGSIELGLLLAHKRVWQAGASAREQRDQATLHRLSKMAEDCCSAAKAQGEAGAEQERKMVERVAAAERMLRRLSQRRSASQVPKAFVCSLSHKIMIDPVVTPAGQCYEREAIERHLLSASADPLNPAEKLSANQLIANLSLKKASDAFLEQHPWAFDEEFTDLA